MGDGKVDNEGGGSASEVGSDVEVTGVGKSDHSAVHRGPPPLYADGATHFGTLEGSVTKCSI